MRTVRYIFLSFILCAIWSTSAMAEEKSQMGQKEVRTVEWFLDNRAALSATTKECNNNPGQLRDDPNCINAAAANHKKWGIRRGVPKF